MTDFRAYIAAARVTDDPAGDFRAFLAAAEERDDDPCRVLVDKLRWRLDLPDTFATCGEFLAYLGKVGIGDPAALRLWGRWLDHRHLGKRAQRERFNAGRDDEPSGGERPPAGAGSALAGMWPEEGA